MSLNVISFSALVSACLASAWGLSAVAGDNGQAQDGATAGQLDAETPSLTKIDKSARHGRQTAAPAKPKSKLRISQPLAERHPAVRTFAEAFAAAPNARAEYFGPFLASNGLEISGWNMLVTGVANDKAGNEIIHLRVSANVVGRRGSPVTILDAYFEETWKLENGRCVFLASKASEHGTGFVIGH